MKLKLSFRKRILAFILAAGLICASLFPYRASADSEAEAWIIVGQLAALIGIETSAAGVETAISVYTGYIAGLAETEEADDEKRDKDDHAALKDVVWLDRTAEIGALYTELAPSGADLSSALSFMDTDSMKREFAAHNPGYRTPAEGSYLDFSEIYKDRVARWQNYVGRQLRANGLSAGNVLDVQSAVVQLDTAAMNASGYRQIMQASNQAANFRDQEIIRLKVDIARQIEAETEFALNAQQERSDAAAAVEQAVSGWKTTSSGGAY